MTEGMHRASRIGQELRRDEEQNARRAEREKRVAGRDYSNADRSSSVISATACDGHL
jgi:hypothetical protein